MRPHVVLSLILLGCGSSSSSLDGSISDHTPTPDVRAGDVGSGDRSSADLPAKKDGAAPDRAPKNDGAAGSWSITGTQITPGFQEGMLSAHPKDAKTIAVKHSLDFMTPNVSVSVSADLGKTIKTSIVKAGSPTGPGYYDTPMGFGYDPTNGNQLAVLTLLPYTSSPPAPPPYTALVFGTSTNGGVSFTVSQLMTNPWPPDGMKWVAGAKSRLAVRSQHVLYISEDLGVSLPAVFNDSGNQCLAHGDFAVSPADPTIFVLMCYDHVLRCEKSVCSNATLPSGTTLTNVARVEFSPVEPARVILADSGSVLLSTDGGKTFAKVALPVAGLSGAWKVAFDPRGGTSTAYLLGRTNGKLFRSTNGGQSYTEISPPASMQPPASTILRDVAVAADGTVVGLAHPGVITLPPP
jgi:hypothetical protein